MEPQEDCFFDCEENLQEHGKRLHDGAVSQLGAGEGTVKNSRNGAPPSCGDSDSSGLSELKRNFEELSVDRLEGEASESTVAPEDGSHGHSGHESVTEEEKDDWTDTEPELKEELAPEFDDEHLKEIEKDLTEEEKESRRKESVALKEKGNSQFKEGEHVEAEESYTAALHICPVSCSKERSILFSNRAAARSHQDKKEEAIKDCSKAIELNPDYVRALLRRAELYEKTDKLDEALEDYKSVLEKDPSLPVAREACMRLPQQIQERNERLKEEMMSKLKDLGNMVLRPFGLSTSNFQVNQDSGSGSYSINFVQNPGTNRR
ncbi:tetratricopeptide repeat protein 1 [Clupea harengus]|uniref:Tetratricopeptide repeat protein 1 n=1 Tax=Clupea harengus TaxID=7950 RepID=A0A6P3W6T7_CLUHA|nr:tetratricopeptide repeat protein 1 [Clupea harengus]XP_031427547.1 tetratricopeptide repeat protein 1 [Clupea harengus]